MKKQTFSNSGLLPRRDQPLGPLGLIAAVVGLFHIVLLVTFVTNIHYMTQVRCPWFSFPGGKRLLMISAAKFVVPLNNGAYNSKKSAHRIAFM